MGWFSYKQQLSSVQSSKVCTTKIGGYTTDLPKIRNKLRNKKKYFFLSGTTSEIQPLNSGINIWTMTGSWIWGWTIMLPATTNVVGNFRLCNLVPRALQKTHQPKTRGFFNSYCGVPWGTDMYQCIFPYVYNIVYIYIYIITYIMFHMKATWSVFPYSFSIFILHFPTKTCHFWGARTWPGDQVSVGGEGIRAWICCGFQRKTRENYDLPCLAIIFTGNLGKQGNVTSRFCSENQGNGWFCCRNHLF